MDKKKLIWVIAHEPIDLFLRAANRFAKEVQSKTDEIEFECLTLSEYSKKYKGGVELTKHDLLDLMDNGDIQMAQMYTNTLGRTHNRDMWALEMPFLFEDHDHATRVFEGEIGQELLDGLSKDHNVKGLAFTYSGGYHIIPSDRAVSTVEGFEGMNVRVAKSPVAIETLEAIGAHAVQMEVEELREGKMAGDVEAGESTWPRYYSMRHNEVLPFIIDTKHSLFLTTILTAADFWADLSDELKEIVQTAAFAAAATERVESIEDINTVTRLAEHDGIPVIEFDEVETAKFKAATAHLYDHFESMFTPGLLDRIKTA